MTIDEKKARALFDMARGHSELGVGYKDADFELFKKDLDTDSKFQEDFRDDLVTAKLLSESIDIDTFRKGLKTSQPSQPPAVSLAPPQRQSIEQQAAGQATGFVPPMAVQPEQPMQPDLGAKSGGLNLGRAFGGVAPVFQDEAQIKQEAQSPVFLANELAAQNIEGAAVSPTQQAVSASQRDFAKMSPEQQAQAIAGSTGSELAESKKPKPTLLQQGKQAISDIASSFNRSVFKAPSAIAKTVSELGTGAYNLMGGDAKVEQDYLYQIADKYDKWIDDSEFAKQFIGDKNVNSLAGDVGSGLGQIATMITAGGGSVAQGLKSAPSLLRGVAEKFLTPASGVAFSQVFSSEYDNMKAKGESDNTALKQALANAFVSAPLESIPLINLTERMNAINPSLARKVINTLAQGFDEMTQERLQQAFSNVTNNQLAQLESSIVKWSEGLDRSGEAGGLTGLIVGAIGQARIKRTKTPEVSGPSGQPPTQLGGIPTIPAPPNAPEFVPPVPPPSGADQTTYETVSPEELQAFRQGQIDPERAAAIADDVALIQSGQMDINSIDDANYRLMVESAMGAGQQEQQGGAAEQKEQVTQENTKQGDLIYDADGNKVEVVGFGKSRGGNDIIEVKTPRPTNQSILEAAQQTVWARNRAYYPKGITAEFLKDFNTTIQDVYQEAIRTWDNSSGTMTIDLSSATKIPILPAENVANATPQSETIVADQAAQNMGTAVNQPLETGAAAVEVGESRGPVVEVEGDQVVEEEGVARKQKQLDIINKTNPAPNDQNTWVRGVEDILSPEEAFRDDDNFIGTPDFTIKDAKTALEKGEVIVYSSYPIKDGVFVTPSKMEAALYAGNKTPYSKKVKLTDVAWIDSNQGQYAEVKAETPKPKTKTQQITDLRAKEQAEYDAMSDPNDEAKREEIYDRYNKLISPLLGEKAPKAKAPSKQQRNRLVGLVQDHNKLPKTKATTEGAKLRERITELAKAQGYTVKQEKGKIIILDDKGKKVNRSPVKAEPLIAATDSEIQVAKKLIDANLFDWNQDPFSDRVKTELDWATIRKGLEQFRNGDTESQAAKQLIAEANRIHKTGGARFIVANNVAGYDVSWEQYFGIQDQLADIDEKQLTPEEIERGANEFDNLTDEQKQQIYEDYEAANKGTEGQDNDEKGVGGENAESIEKNTKESDNKVNSQNETGAKQPVAGNRLFNRPIEIAKEIADRYFKAAFGTKRPNFEGTRKLDKERSKRIADAYAAMKHDPNNPEVKAAYEAMVKETIDQYKAILAEGYFIEINNEEAYANSEEMIEDLRNNKRMKIFSTESGYGDSPITDQQRKENPLLRDSGFKDKNGIPLLNNDVFRAVHDFFGHAELGNSFGALGEENAWNVHSRMYSPLARKAVTTETRGQNSYVNFSGVNQEAQKLLDEAARLRSEGKFEEALKITESIYEKLKFADQKIGLLPEEFNAYDGESNLDSKTSGSLTPFQTKDKEGQAARAALKESVGPKEFKRLENIAKNGEKILKDLQSRQILKIDCP